MAGKITVTMCSKCEQIAGFRPSSKYCGDGTDKDNGHRYEKRELDLAEYDRRKREHAAKWQLNDDINEMRQKAQNGMFELVYGGDAKAADVSRRLADDHEPLTSGWVCSVLPFEEGQGMVFVPGVMLLQSKAGWHLHVYAADDEDDPDKTLKIKQLRTRGDAREAARFFGTKLKEQTDATKDLKRTS